ncbi:hypothetical protein [Desulfovermiculus halophilus]|uniref:hypothetical protein n=1 Tax=Desulfovermiculus halophilus TaxID=339722 RepID=UPI0012947A1E|nr:hypothetical protein [Desulfovermiculus halophilus]
MANSKNPQATSKNLFFLSVQDCAPEIAQRIGFHKGKQEQLHQLLRDFELGYCLEEDGFSASLDEAP